MSKKLSAKKMVIIFAVIIGIIFIGIAFFFAIQKYIINYSKDNFITENENVKADAILVLGARVYDDGNLSPMLKDRLDHAIILYKKGIANKVIVSGDNGTEIYDEVNPMKNYLIKNGVKPYDVFMDHAGFDTYDSLYRARDIFNAKSVIVCTQKYHLYRAVYIGNRLGMKTYGFPAEDKSIYNMKYNNKRESLARVKAFIDVEILKSKPKFLGDVFNISGDGRVTWD